MSRRLRRDLRKSVVSAGYEKIAGDLEVTGQILGQTIDNILATLDVLTKGATGVPVKLTISSCEGAFRTIQLKWIPQYNLSTFAYYEVQVSDDDAAWYSLRMDGTDWKHTLDDTTATGGPFIVHVMIPFGGTAEAPTGKLLYYRVRQVTTDGTTGEWSDSASATTSTVQAGDLAAQSVYANNIVANSITANELELGLLNTLVANIKDNLTISDALGWQAGGLGTPSNGDRRAYLDEDEMALDYYVDPAWYTLVHIQTSDVGSIFLSSLNTSSAPYIHLQAHGSAEPYVRMSNGTNNWHIRLNADDEIEVYDATNSLTALTIAPSTLLATFAGNVVVGGGSAQSGYELTVNGDIYASGNVVVGGGSAQSGYELTVNGEAYVSSDVDIDGFLDLGTNADTITADPPTAGTSTGWKVGLYGDGYTIGIAAGTLALRTGTHVSVFSGANPANDGTADLPDSNACVSMTEYGLILDSTASSYGFIGSEGNFHVLQNAYYNGGWRRMATGTATVVQTALSVGEALRVASASSGSAGTAITWNALLVVEDDGGVGIGTATPEVSASANKPCLAIENNTYLQLRIASSASSAGLELKPASGDSWELQANSSGVFFYNRTDNEYALLIDGNSNVVIGGTTASTGYVLTVHGDIHLYGGYITSGTKDTNSTSWVNWFTPGTTTEVGIILTTDPFNSNTQAWLYSGNNVTAMAISGGVVNRVRMSGGVIQVQHTGLGYTYFTVLRLRT